MRAEKTAWGGGVIAAAVVGAAFVASPGLAQKPNDIRIWEAVQALPESERDGATVLGVDVHGTLDTLRIGTNEHVCLADAPGDTQFMVSCYHRDLSPFMARGRALRAEGLETAQLREARAREIERGELPFPRRSTLVSLFGSLASEGASPDSVTSLHVIYLPFATGAEIGLPEQPGNGPWLMDPGQHRAHVMISRPARVFPKR